MSTFPRGQHAIEECVERRVVSRALRFLLQRKVRELMHDDVLERSVRHVRELQTDPETPSLRVRRSPRTHFLDVKFLELHAEARQPEVEESLNPSLKPRSCEMIFDLLSDVS